MTHNLQPKPKLIVDHAVDVMRRLVASAQQKGKEWYLSDVDVLDFKLEKLSESIFFADQKFQLLLEPHQDGLFATYVKCFRAHKRNPDEYPLTDVTNARETLESSFIDDAQKKAWADVERINKEYNRDWALLKAMEAKNKTIMPPPCLSEAWPPELSHEQIASALNILNISSELMVQEARRMGRVAHRFEFISSQEDAPHPQNGRCNLFIVNGSSREESLEALPEFIDVVVRKMLQNPNNWRRIEVKEDAANTRFRVECPEGLKDTLFGALEPLIETEQHRNWAQKGKTGKNNFIEIASPSAENILGELGVDITKIPDKPTLSR